MGPVKHTFEHESVIRFDLNLKRRKGKLKNTTNITPSVLKGAIKFDIKDYFTIM